jgi:hypothetical protein
MHYYKPFKSPGVFTMSIFNYGALLVLPLAVHYPTCTPTRR